jgi:hypothetical protein
MTNRRELERELGDIYAAIDMMVDARNQDVSAHGIGRRMIEKKESVKRWLHHQEARP